MCRNTDLMDDICDICLQVSCSVCALFFSHNTRTDIFADPAVASSSQVLNAVQKDLIVKRLQHIIFCAKAESVLCDPFLSNR